VPGDYVELRARSAFSFLDGASNPEDLAERAAELGHPALALADRDGLYGIPRFHAAATRAGLRAIVGAELSDAAGRPLQLLVESPQGYRNLARLLTIAQGNAPKGEARVSWDELEAHAHGLVALIPAEGVEGVSGTADRGGPGARWSGSKAQQETPPPTVRNRASHGAEARPWPDPPARWLDRARNVFGRDRTFLAAARSKDRALEAQTRRAVAEAESLGIPIVATGDVRAAKPEGRKLLDAFACLRHRTTLDRAGRLLLPNAERTLRRPAETAARFADRPAWLAATRAVAERCAFGLADLGYRFPTFPTAPGESQAALLRRLTFAGARRRYGEPLAARVRAQLEHELAVIGKLDLAGYFLIVWDIARYARAQGILCQGRGSAANSAVCYALEITAVDPVGMELLFERFLSEERGEWPDIDLDLPSGDPREKTIQYVYERYGPHGVGMTATVITYRTRSAFREMGKVLGMAEEQLDRVAKHLHQLRFREDLDDVKAMLRAAGVDPEGERIRLLLELAGQVQGLPRHLGQHTGGLVIAAGRLDEVVPIEPAAMPGRRVIQWDKDDCADLGLIKIDLLGLGMLDALARTLPLIRAHEGKEIDLAHLPPDDPKTYAMIQRADTVGVFQIESRAQMATLPRMKPKSFYDLVVEIAIIRPGPIVGQMVHPYLNRRAGREPVAYPHPSLEPILARTLGVPIFQEQLLRVAMTAAGFTGGEAEELRRAMGFKRSVERMGQIEARLRSGMQERGITGAAQDEIVRGITSFALYGFPESHSASFALIAYASAYLRAHHPAAFLAGMLNAYPLGFYSPATLVKDAQRHGVAVRPIDVTRSEWECTLEAGSGPAHASAPWLARSSAASTDSGGDGTRPSGDVSCCALLPLRHAPAPPRGAPSVRVGLRYVRGLSGDTGRRLVGAREAAVFTSLADFAARVGPKKNELEALAEAGALAGIDARAAGRRSALWQVGALERDPRSLFAGIPPPDAEAESPLEELGALETTLADYRSTGLTTGPHVMAHLRPGLAARGVLSARELRAAPNGRFVRTAGHVIVRQRPGSAKGFCFVTLEDETGTLNGVFTPDQFERLRGPLHAAPLIEIAGPVQNVDGVIHVRVREVRPLAAGDVPASHDYH
jgi:error-prone DNA polymerase